MTCISTYGAFILEPNSNCKREGKKQPPQLPNTTMTILHGFQQTFKVLNRSSILPYFLQQMKIVRYILVDFIAELGRGLPVSHKQ